MSDDRCERIPLAELTDFAAGTLPEVEAAALEEHLFTCSACAARAVEAEALVRAIGAAARSAEVGGFVTDALLNRLARDGVRVRTFTLSPGDVVPCAVWDGDQLLALRLRGDFGKASRVTLTQHVGGAEVVRVTGELADEASEFVFATPAGWIRDLPVVQVELQVLAADEPQERVLARYTLEHGGALRHP